MEQEKRRDTFRSQFGVIMSFAGMAIGLGNCWRFPYLCGKWGGGAFVFAYIIGLVLIVVPLAILEAAVGKQMQAGLIDTYSRAYKNKTVGKVVGGVSTFCNWSQNIFYLSTVAALCYFAYACGTSMWNRGIYGAEMNEHFRSSTVLYVAMFLIVLFFTLWTGLRGVARGIETLSTYAIPAMMLLFIITFAILAATTPNIVEGLNYYLNPDFSKLKDPGLWAAAIAQALFSIGVGPGILLVYGSHMKKNGEIPLTMLTICTLDTLAALLVGLTVIPACVAYGADPQSGSKLVFVILPQIFEKIPCGNIIAPLLFIGMICAAFTSAVGNQETVLTTYGDGFKWGRKKVVFIFGMINLVFGLIAMFNNSFMTFWETVAGDYTFLPSAAIGGFTFAYIIGVKATRDEAINPTTKYKIGGWFDKWVKFVSVPVMILFMAYTFVGLFR